MAKPRHFGLDLRSPEPSTREVADEIALHVYDDPPPWVENDWTTKFDIDYQPTRRSKARGSSTTNPKRDRVLSEMAKARPGDVFSTGFGYLPPERGDRWTFIETSWTRWFHMGVTAFDVGAGGLENARFGSWALGLASKVLSVAPPCWPSASWFGAYNVHPYAEGPRSTDALPGYGWLVTLPSALRFKLGRLADGPARLSNTVVAPDGDEITILVLTDAPAEVNDSLLREWKRFLSPALVDSNLEARAVRYRDLLVRIPNAPEVHRPPMILPEDWPDLGGMNDQPGRFE